MAENHVLLTVASHPGDSKFLAALLNSSNATFADMRHAWAARPRPHLPAAFSGDDSVFAALAALARSRGFGPAAEDL